MREHIASKQERTEILRALQRKWDENPNLRFGQLLGNIGFNYHGTNADALQSIELPPPEPRTG